MKKVLVYVCAYSGQEMQKFFLIWNSNNWNNRLAKLRQLWEASWSRLQEIYAANFGVLRIVSFFSLNFDYNYSMSVARVVSRSRNDVNSRHVDSHKSKFYNFMNNVILKHFSYYTPNNFHINIEQRKKISQTLRKSTK